MTAPTVSVIVPVYQVKPYLPCCIDSLLNQTLTNIELICVDDESNDGSLDILYSYAAKDSRIRVIELDHQGISSARNAGLDAAQGDYVVFVDSDDFIAKEMLFNLLQIAERDGADCVICSYIDVDPKSSLPLSSEKRSGDTQSIPTTPINPGTFVVWNKLIRRSLIEKYGIRFIDGLCYAEDTTFNYCLLPHCKQISRTDQPFYFHRLRKDSLSHISSASKHVLGMLDACEYILNHYKKFDIESSFRRKWLDFVVHSLKRIRSYAPHSQQARATRKIHELLRAFAPSEQELQSLRSKDAKRLRDIMKGKSNPGLGYYWRRAARRIQTFFKTQ